MKVLSYALALVCLSEGTSAFTAKPSFAVSKKLQQRSKSPLYGEQPFFADNVPKEAPPAPPAEPAEPAAPAQPVSVTQEDEVEQLVQEEMRKTRKISNLRNQNGVDYAPWMNISAEDEQKIRQLMQEKTAARRKRQEQEQNVSGALLMDSQAQELSGGGLKSKVIDQDVELEWATSSERNTKGYMVKRRPAKTDEFEVIASYTEWGPLASKGPQGGVYRFMDETLPSPGGWVYRITECENNGRESDICQCLVEVQTPEEQRGAIIGVAVISLLGIAAVAAGLLLDPIQ